MSTALKHRAIFPILFLMFFDQLCLSLLFPLLTLLFFDKASRLFAVDTRDAVRSVWYGVSLSLPHLVNVFMTPFLSSLSDVWGRKKILLIAMSGAFIMTLIGAFSIIYGCLGLFLVGCLIQGIFSRTDPIAIAAMGDIIPEENKVVFMGYLQTAISLGAFIGPLLSGMYASFYFTEINFAFPYLLASAFALIGLFILKCFFHETLTTPAKHLSLKLNVTAFKKLFKQPLILKMTLILLLSQFSWRLYYLYIPPILKTQFSFNPHQLGLFIGMVAFWLILATLFGIRCLKKKLSTEQVLQFGLWAVFLGLIFTLIFCEVKIANWVWIAAVPIAMGDVIAFSCITSLYSNAVLPAEQGKVMGICFIAVAIVWAATGMIGGFLMSLHPLLPLAIAPLGILAALNLKRLI